MAEHEHELDAHPESAEAQAQDYETEMRCTRRRLRRPHRDDVMAVTY